MCLQAAVTDGDDTDSVSLCSFAYFNGEHGVVQNTNSMSCGDHGELHRIEFIVNETRFEMETTANLDIYYKMNSTNGIGRDFANRHYVHYGMAAVSLVHDDGPWVTPCDVQSKSVTVLEPSRIPIDGTSTVPTPSPLPSPSASPRPSWPTPVPSHRPTTLPNVHGLDEPTSFPSFEPTADPIPSDLDPTPSAVPTVALS